MSTLPDSRDGAVSRRRTFEPQRACWLFYEMLVAEALLSHASRNR